MCFCDSKNKGRIADQVGPRSMTNCKNMLDSLRVWAGTYRSLAVIFGMPLCCLHLSQFSASQHVLY